MKAGDERQSLQRTRRRIAIALVPVCAALALGALYNWAFVLWLLSKRQAESPPAWTIAILQTAASLGLLVVVAKLAAIAKRLFMPIESILSKAEEKH